MTPRVAVVVPAYNEAPRVGAVVRAARAVPAVTSVLVVDDAGTDGTAEAALAAGAEVLRLPRNGGKGAAMVAGGERVREDVVCFLDGDLDMIRPSHIEALITAWAEGARMVVGPLTDGQRWLWSVLAGPRVMSTHLWRWAVRIDPEIADSRYGVEVRLAVLANRYDWDVVTVPLSGMRFVSQAVKWGSGGGHVLRQARVWSQVVAAASRASRKGVVREAIQPFLCNFGFKRHRVVWRSFA